MYLCRSQAGRVGKGEPFNCGFIWLLHRRKGFLFSQNISLNIWTFEHLTLQHLNIWTFDRTFDHLNTWLHIWTFDWTFEHLTEHLNIWTLDCTFEHLTEFWTFQWTFEHLYTWLHIWTFDKTVHWTFENFNEHLNIWTLDCTFEHFIEHLTEHLHIWLNIWTFHWTLEHFNIWLQIWTFDRTCGWSPQRFPLFPEQCNRSLPWGRAAQIRRKLEKFGLFMWISAYLCTQESYKIEPNAAAGGQREPSIFGRYNVKPLLWATKQQCTLNYSFRVHCLQCTQKLSFILGSK